MASDKPTIKSEVLKKIDNDTKMHSSGYFVVLAAATVISAILLTTLSAVLARLLFDDFDDVRRAGLFGLGADKRQFVVGGFPWELLMLTIISIWGTLKLYKKMDISYKHGSIIFYTSVAVSILFIATLVGNPALKGPIERNQFFNSLKTASKRLDDKTARGFLIDINDEELTMILPDKGKLEVEIGDARLIGLPKIGGPVIVIGEWGEDEIMADVIDFDGPPHIKRRN